MFSNLLIITNKIILMIIVGNGTFCIEGVKMDILASLNLPPEQSEGVSHEGALSRGIGQKVMFLQK